MKTLLILLSILGILTGNGSAQEVFRLRFAAYDLVPNDPFKNSFQVNYLDLRQPVSFLGIGEVIPKTKLKLVRFESKSGKDAQGSEIDLSELTVRNVETGEEFVLPLNKVINAPGAGKAK